MRIKKVSQTAGLVGSIVNSQSESNKDTYSCDYINNSFIISEFETKTPTITQSGTLSSGNINVGTSDLKNIVQMNGTLVINKTGDRMPMYIETDLRPTNNIEISGCFVTYDTNNNVNVGTITIDTTGKILWEVYNNWRGTIAIIFLPVTIYIN